MFNKLLRAGLVFVASQGCLVGSDRPVRPYAPLKTYQDQSVRLLLNELDKSKESEDIFVQRLYAYTLDKDHVKAEGAKRAIWYFIYNHSNKWLPEAKAQGDEQAIAKHNRRLQVLQKTCKCIKEQVPLLSQDVPVDQNGVYVQEGGGAATAVGDFQGSHRFNVAGSRKGDLDHEKKDKEHIDRLASSSISQGDRIKQIVDYVLNVPKDEKKICLWRNEVSNRFRRRGVLKTAQIESKSLAKDAREKKQFEAARFHDQREIVFSKALEVLASEDNQAKFKDGGNAWAEAAKTCRDAQVSQMHDDGGETMTPDNSMQQLARTICDDSFEIL